MNTAKTVRAIVILSAILAIGLSFWLPGPNDYDSGPRSLVITLSIINLLLFIPTRKIIAHSKRHGLLHAYSSLITGVMWVLFSFFFLTSSPPILKPEDLTFDVAFYGVIALFTQSLTLISLLVAAPTYLIPVISHSAERAIFISYRRKNTAYITGRIYDRLIQTYGPDTVFKDVDSIAAGEDFKKALDKSIGQCRVVLAIIDPEWLVRLSDPSDFVRVELEAAFEQEKPIIPVLVNGATIPLGDELPDTIEGLTYLNASRLRPDPDFSKDIKMLIKSVDNYL